MRGLPSFLKLKTKWVENVRKNVNVCCFVLLTLLEASFVAFWVRSNLLTCLRLIALNEMIKEIV